MKPLTITKAAEYLCCSPEFIRQKAANGEILGSKITGQWLFEEQSLVNFLRSGYPVERQKLVVIDCNKQEEKLCQSTNEKGAISTGYRSNRQQENKYAELLALPTKSRPRNSTIS